MATMILLEPFVQPSLSTLTCRTDSMTRWPLVELLQYFLPTGRRRVNSFPRGIMTRIINSTSVRLIILGHDESLLLLILKEKAIFDPRTIHHVCSMFS